MGRRGLCPFNGVERVTAMLKVYVSPQGSDCNDGLTPETPLKTVRKAVQLADAAGGGQIQLGVGTYPEEKAEPVPSPPEAEE